MAITTRKFPSEFTNRGTVKTTDKVMIYNSDTGDSDEFSLVSEITKIQDDAIAALDAVKVDKVTGKSLILDTEIARLANITNQTLGGLGGEPTANKKTTITDSDVDFPTGKAVKTALALKLDKSSVANNLTTTVEGLTLDARQGKELEGKKINRIELIGFSLISSILNYTGTDFRVIIPKKAIKEISINSLSEQGYLYVFQGTFVNSIPTLIRVSIKATGSSDATLFNNTSNPSITLITSGLYIGYYKCMLNEIDYVIIDPAIFISTYGTNFSFANYPFQIDKFSFVIDPLQEEIYIQSAESAAIKVKSKLVCDGVNDDILINRYLLSIQKKGGKIKLSEGTFNIGQPIGNQLQTSNGCLGIEIQGAGKGTTILKMKSSGLIVNSFNLNTLPLLTGNVTIGNQPTPDILGNYRALKWAIYDIATYLKKYTITVNGTDKNDAIISVTETRDYSTTPTNYATGTFNQPLEFKTITNIVISNTTLGTTIGEYCYISVSYLNSENNVFRFYNLNNITIRDLSIDGNYTNTLLNWQSTDHIKNGIFFDTCNNINLDSIESSNNYHHGILGIGCNHINITNSIFNSNGHRAVHFHYKSAGIIFAGNICENNGRNNGITGDYNTSGIFLVFGGNDVLITNNKISGDTWMGIDIKLESSYQTDVIRNCIISNNTIDSSEPNAIGIYISNNNILPSLIDTRKLRGLIISNNQINVTKQGILCENMLIDNLSINGNQIISNGTGNAVDISGYSNASRTVKNMILSNNIIQNTESILIRYIKSLSLGGNIIEGSIVTYDNDFQNLYNNIYV